jgi:hypothetical protein
MTITDEIYKILNEIRDHQDMMDGHVATGKLNELSVWHSSLVSHIADREHAYQKKLMEVMNEDEKRSVARSEVIAKASEEYLDYRKAVLLEKSVIEAIRNLRRWIDVRKNEQEAVNSY